MHTAYESPLVASERMGVRGMPGGGNGSAGDDKMRPLIDQLIDFLFVFAMAAFATGFAAMTLAILKNAQ